MPLRFEIEYDEPAIAWEPLVDEVFGELTSSFLEMPQGEGFIDYPTFAKGYQALKRSTGSFAALTSENVFDAVRDVPIAFVVFRCILGFSPPEWAYVTSEMTGIAVDQGIARSIDRNIRLNPTEPDSMGSDVTVERIRAMIDAGVRTVLQGRGTDTPGIIHRLDKVDTHAGKTSLRSIADLGAPYPVLLYERFLGRPFATHRDSVSELVGEVAEVAVKNVLSDAKIQLSRSKASRTHSRVRSSSRLHRSRRIHASCSDRGEARRGRRDGTRQGHPRPAPAYTAG